MSNLGDGIEFGADELSQLQQSFEPAATTVQAIAQSHEGNSRALLALLRMIESLHREIRDGLFQQSLPTNRQALYALLRDIEAEGGWPYIHRMKLQSLLANLAENLAENTEHSSQDDLETDSNDTFISTEASTAGSGADTEI